MIIDTSAVMTILLDEADAAQYVTVMIRAPSLIMSAGTYVEFGIIVRSRQGFDAAAVDEALARWGVVIVPLSPTQARLAIEAFAAFGKGFHAARLNYGDCFAYALAKERGEPLLFKGSDFARTDIAAAI
jgi:ribonuclease VapC